MNKKLLLFIAGGAGFIILTLSIIGWIVNSRPVDNSPITLTVYMPFDEVEIYRNISADWLARNPRVRLNFRYIEARDAAEYESRVVNELADGIGPDIWLVRSDWIPKHASKSVPYNPVGVDGIQDAYQALIPAVVDINSHNGQLFGVPLFADSLALIANDSFFTNLLGSISREEGLVIGQNPTTWDILKSQVAIATSSQGDAISRSGIAMGTVETMYAPSDVLTAIMAQYGVSILNEQRDDVSFNLSRTVSGQSFFPARDALDLFTSFARSSEPNYSWNNFMGNAVDAFKSGRTGMIIGYHSLFRSLSSEVDFDLVLAPLPQLGGGPRVDYGISWSHIVSNQSPYSGLAWDYLAYLAEAEVQGFYSNQTGKISPSRRLGSLPSVIPQVYRANQAGNLFRAQLSSVASIEKPEWQRADEILQDMVRQVTNFGQSPQTAVDSAAARFRQERWFYF